MSDTGFDRPDGDKRLIEAELMPLPGRLRGLPLVDRVEGFKPGGSMYRRVLAAADCCAQTFAAWNCDSATLRAANARMRRWPAEQSSSFSSKGSDA